MREFVEKYIHGAIAESSPFGIRILSAPPGKGKSRHSMQVVHDLLGSGKIRRVLWAVHGISGDSSLGQEASREFTDLRVRNLVVYGKDEYERIHGRASKGYGRQMYWPSEPSVKIISHARLPLLFGKEVHRSSSLRDADLLVIDEDPFLSFLQTCPGDTKLLGQAWLVDAAGTCRVCAALCTLIRRAREGLIESRATTWGDDWKQQIHSLAGNNFYELLESELPSSSLAPPDWQTFTKVLKRMGQPAWVAKAFREDLERFHGKGEAHMRFGLYWETFKSTKQRNVWLRWDLNTFKSFPLPTVILDAYADLERYQALFAPQAVTLEPLDSESKPIQIEWLEGFNLNPHNIERGRAKKNLRQTLDEVLEQTQPDDTLVLNHKRATRGVEAEIKSAATLYNYTHENLKFHHWHAGRGLNKWKDHHVVALTKPALPRVFTEHTLTALYPSQRQVAERKRATLQADRGELLQMLHRGRQTVSDLDKKLRVITFFDPTDLTTLELAQVHRLSPKLIHTKHSSNPHWREAVKIASGELKAMFGGVPQLALLVLRLVPEKSEYDRTWREVGHGWLEPHIRHRGGPLLRKWLAEGAGAFMDTRPMTNFAPQLESFFKARRMESHALGGISSGRPGHRIGQQIIFVVAPMSEVKAKRVFDCLRKPPKAKAEPSTSEAARSRDILE